MACPFDGNDSRPNIYGYGNKKHMLLMQVVGKYLQFQQQKYMFHDKKKRAGPFSGAEYSLLAYSGGVLQSRW